MNYGKKQMENVSIPLEWDDKAFIIEAIDFAKSLLITYNNE